MVNAAVAEKVKEYLQQVEAQGLPVSFGVVFGSQVTGETHEYSDIDLLVVSPRFDPPHRSHEDVTLLWNIAGREDVRIEPIACGERAWEEDDEIPIFEVARLEGEKIEIH